MGWSWQARLAAAVAAAVLAAGAAVPAAAQGAKPRLDRVEPAEVLPGGVVTVHGTNMSDAREDLEVTVDGNKAVLLEASVDAVKLMLPPEAKPGKVRIQVAVAGTRSNTIELTILEPTPANVERIAARDRQQHEGASEVEEQVEQMLKLDAPRASSERGRTVIRFSGRAAVPDGCIIAVDLRLGGQFVANAQVEVDAQGRFQGQFGPFLKRLFAGLYDLEAHFRLHDQPAKIRHRFRQAFPGKEGEKRSHLTDRQFVRLGSPEQERIELEEMRKHFRTMADRLLALLEELELHFSSAGRSVFRTAEGKLDEQAWLEWLDRRSLRGLSAEDRARFLQKLRSLEQDMLSPDGGFDEPEWREWMDYRFREEVIGLARAHQAERDRWQVVKFHDAWLELEELCSTLLRLSQERSKYLYERNGLPVAQSDLRPPGGDVLRLGPSAPSPAGIRRGLERILRQVGL